jgi:hypothetical protein
MIEKDIFFEKNINKKEGVILDFFSIEFKLFIFFKKILLHNYKTNIVNNVSICFRVENKYILIMFGSVVTVVF